jgi:ABC-2 type transport system ATP-binding protein
MKVGELLIFFAELKGVSPSEARKRSQYWLERLDLSRWTTSKVEELSKGMQQKVQFIAAVLHEPEFMILDEPFSGLDPENAMELKNILLEMKKAGRTILFSTHRMDTVEKLCDSICLVNQGRTVLQGDLKQIKSSYGRSSIQVEYEGQVDFLTDSSLVQSSNYVELKMQPGVDSQKLLARAMQSAQINRFELVEPSLEEIFIDTVKSSKVVANNA